MKEKLLHIFTLEPFNGRMRYVLRHEGVAVDYYLCRAAVAVERAAAKVEDLANLFDQPSEFKVRRHDGTYSPARTYPRSADPRRSKG